MSEYESAWMRSDEGENDGKPKPRKRTRPIPRAASPDSIDARIAQINADARARWQEAREC